MTVKITNPDGSTETRGPYTGDATGGSHFDFAPDKVGNWTFQFFYGGQTTTTGVGFTDLKEMPSQSEVYTLVVQQEPITQSSYPIAPLPTKYWETPVSAQNVQEWYKIMGPWLGTGLVGSAKTGLYNESSTYNPYTDSVLSGHVLWTKPWCAGGVVGGAAGGTEDTGNYWSTRQYMPQYAPVIMNGRMYSTWYAETQGYSAGIVCTDLYTGETLFTINTTSVLQCGMETEWKTANMYGVVGPYLITVGTLSASETGGTKPANVGTQYNMYSAFTGNYVLSIVNGTSLTLKTDDNGNLIGYYINSTVGTMNIYNQAGLKATVNITASQPFLCCFNMSQALWQSGSSFQWSPSQNAVVNFGLGVMWAKPVPTQINGVPINNPPLNLGISPWCALTGNSVILTSGIIHMANQQPGYIVLCGMDQTTGEVLMCKNYTYPECQSLQPFTNDQYIVINGLVVLVNMENWKCDAIDLSTGNIAWKTTLTTPYGDGTPNVYSILGGINFIGQANGRLFIEGFGGDMWALNATTGNQLWYTNTTTLIGAPSLESPYGVWPLWPWSGTLCFSNDVAYCAVGHEYDPPLFHGAQLLAVNLTSGELVWNELGFYDVSLSIAYNTLLTLNCYDNQIYAFGKGPTSTTVNAPSVGVTTATPITITGTVMDVSAGVQQSQVAKDFPNGLPCVSDASQSKWMEYVYQDQVMPSNATGVTVTLGVLDSNNNFRQIGTTTSDASGKYGFTWTPDIPGNYTLYASFAGSNSYYPSSAETYIYASTPAPTVSPYPVQSNPLPLTEMYIAAAAVAMIVAVAIVGALLLVAVRKRP